MPFQRKKFKNNFKNDKKHANKYKEPASRYTRTTTNFKHEQQQLTEKDVGITEFVSKLEGFNAVIKSRFSDFHVNEINLNNKVAKLNDTSVPEDFHEKASTTYDGKCPTDLIPEEIWNSIKSLSEEDDNPEVNFDVTEFSKEDRKIVHKAISNSFPHKLVTNTLTKDDKKYICVKKANKSGNNDRRKEWPSGKGEYVHFLVYKEALDTMDVCMRISDSLRMPSSAFTYAGVKDKRAKTTQWFCVRKVDPFKLLKRTHALRSVCIGNFSFKNEPLKLGHLSGNRFRIALRNVLADDELIKASADSLKDNGFINYYGLQRFGNDKEVPTYEIGKQLLLGNWKEACSLILKVKKSDDQYSDVTKAKKVYSETQDAKKACDCLNFSRNKCVEAKLLAGLAKLHSNDYVTALETIPRNMRLLYIHSFQSLIWNKMASKRIQLHGTKLVPGDMVMTKSNDEIPEEILSEAGDLEQTETNDEVKILQEKDLEQYSIYDIVLPLPGYNIIYPENLKSAYKEVLEEHGLSLEMPQQKVKTYSLSGAYRKLFGKVNDFSWKIMYYNEPEYSLIRSDLEEMRGQAEPKNIEGGKYKALILNFSLNPSNYATMVLREILKHDTSSSSQAKLNDYHKNDSKGPSNKISSEKCQINETKSKDKSDPNLEDNADINNKRSLENEAEGQPPNKLAKVDTANSVKDESKIDSNAANENEEG